MPECPCCSQTLLRHIRHKKVYWFCTHCWQEMPNLAEVNDRSLVAAIPPAHMSVTTLELPPRRAAIAVHR